ncbi:metal ABC transporter ATP-binding protein [Arcanobacterium bovis]|uniref:Metal ABC transporter ATP-binding protein n=1 Tax=Arcanobacterium bovis TaxID=2529275 RepID=A0A4V2KQZ6_9ACTO|nr:metal ABC transporter ATP-binding protein [Arcanobacterium bovis]TBW20947.1 metal ABC transporter ATP-binding protein [Arcanobacterium bovis]
MTPVLSVTDMCVAYREELVLDRVSFELPAGEIMGIVGPNGAGKSTLMRAMLDLVPTLAGEAAFFGKQLRHVRKRIGYMPQQSDVDWDFPATVYDVVMMGTYGSLGWLRRPRSKQKRAVERALAQVGISDLAGRQIGQLSGGQKQRTFLARTLVADPDLILMDEPFAGVDVASEKAIVKALIDLRAKGKTIVLVHHDLSTLANFCSWVLLLNKCVTAAGPIHDVFHPHIVEKTYGVAHHIEVPLLMQPKTPVR